MSLENVYAKYPDVTFTCVAWPESHEIGCKCKDDWTKEQLLDALLTKKAFEQKKWQDSDSRLAGKKELLGETVRGLREKGLLDQLSDVVVSRVYARLPRVKDLEDLQE